jgi:hypothetical protein
VGDVGMSRSGADLALLLLGGFRSLVDAAIAELALRGYEDVRPVHDFAMRAIAAGADNASELGRAGWRSARALRRTRLDVAGPRRADLAELVRPGFVSSAASSRWLHRRFQFAYPGPGFV